MNAGVGSEGAFCRHLCVGCFVGVGDVDTKEEREWIVRGSVLVSLEEIILVMG